MCEDGAGIVSSGRLGERESREHRIKAGGLPLALSLARKGGGRARAKGSRHPPPQPLFSPVSLAILLGLPPFNAASRGWTRGGLRREGVRARLMA